MSMTTPNSDLTISLTRTLRASPERVFAAWTDPAKLAKWFGPDGFTTTTHAFDLRPGGAWKHTMRGPDGKEYPNHIVFVEVDAPRRLVYDHVSPPAFRTTVTFEPEGEGTRMSFRMVFGDANAYKVATETYGAVEGLRQTVGRLAAFVEGDAPKGAAGGFTLQRTFKAAPEKVWAMWTTKEGIEKWWVPSMKEMGFDMRVLAMDVRVGGKYAFEMVGNGHRLVNGGTYTLVKPPSELGWTWHFDIYLAPGEKPYDVPILLALEKLPEGGTRMTFTQGPLATPGHTEGSRQGTLKNFEMLAKALGE